MAEKTLNTRQKQKYDTSTNWTTNNPVLLAGELGIESDTNKFKIGNGTSAWNELDYAGGGEVVLYSTTGQNTDGAMTQKATTDALPQCIEIEMNMQTGQASITVEQFEKLLENPENYIVVNMSLTDSDGSTRTESVKFTRGSYRKAETSSYWVEHLLFNSVNTGDTEKTPYMYLILARHSISPNDICIGMGGEEYATVNQLNNKVDKVTNMGLSTNDYTTADKNKLAGIEAGAEVNPTSLSELSEDATHRLVTDTEKTTWNAKSDFSGSYNDLTDKPTIPTSLSELTEDSAHRLVTDTEKAAWNAKSDFSGSYNDLTNKPTIPTTLAELTEDSTHRLVTDTEKSTWNAKSDFSGDYNDLTNKPTIPTINVNGTPQSTINFDSDPQAQIDNRVTLDTEQLIKGSKKFTLNRTSFTQINNPTMVFEPITNVPGFSDDNIESQMGGLVIYPNGPLNGAIGCIYGSPTYGLVFRSAKDNVSPGAKNYGTDMPYVQIGGGESDISRKHIPLIGSEKSSYTESELGYNGVEYGCVKFSNGLQICTGVLQHSSEITVVNISDPFLNEKAYNVFEIGANANSGYAASFSASPVSSSSFNLRYGTSTQVYGRWIAIGWWK